MYAQWTPFRVQPKLPVHVYDTYMIHSPVSTHTRPATCAEVDCVAARDGWITKIDVSTQLGAQQANYIRLKSGRHFTYTQVGSIVSFVFPAGQRCFADHRIKLERPELFIKRGGDWRQQTSDPIRMRAVDWVDDFANHQADLAEHVKRG